MNNWDDFRFFLALYRHKTLKLAAKELQTDQATVGRRIYALEEKLKTSLFEKRSEGFFLTVSGERIRSTLEDVENSFHTIDRKIAGKDEKMEGVVRIAMPGALANHLVIPNLKEFTASFPQIELQFLTGSEVLNLNKREADMAFRFVRPSQQELIVKKIGDVTLSLFGSKKLLKANKKIESYEDLASFPFVGLFTKATSQMEKDLLGKLSPHLQDKVLTSMAWSSVYAAVTNNIGLGILPSFMAGQNSLLEAIPLAPSEKMALWYVVHPEVQKNRRFAAFSNFLISFLKQNLN